MPVPLNLPWAKTYILQPDGSVKQAASEEEFLMGSMQLGHCVARSELLRKKTVATVSTVFLSLDHSHGGPQPLLFETAVLAADYEMRYPTWKAAIRGHRKIVAHLESEGYQVLKTQYGNAKNKEMGTFLFPEYDGDGRPTPPRAFRADRNVLDDE